MSELNDLLKKAFRRGSPAHMFSVVSWGCAGTSWLATVLNSHPEIFCVHAANFTWSQLAEVALVDVAAWRYLLTLGFSGRPHLAAGDVHGVSRHQIEGVRQRLGDMFSCAVVVREPIARLRSQVGLFRIENFQGWGDLSYVDGICERIGLRSSDLSQEQRLFIHGANMLNAIEEEQDLARVFKIEALSDDPAQLVDLVATLTNGKVQSSRDWASAAVARRRANMHAGETVDFDDWQKDVVKRVVSPASWEAYRRLGYEVPA